MYLECFMINYFVTYDTYITNILDIYMMNSDISCIHTIE
jgi:hypothetical protein